jgi:hypothetical protein
VGNLLLLLTTSSICRDIQRARRHPGTHAKLRLACIGSTVLLRSAAEAIGAAAIAPARAFASEVGLRGTCAIWGNLLRSRDGVRLWNRVRFFVRRLVIKRLLPSTMRARLYNQIRASAAVVRRLAVPASVLSVRVFARVVHAAGFLALTTLATWDVDFDAAVDERAAGGVLGACGHVAVDGAEVVPKRVLRGLQIVLDLDNAGWGDAVVRDVAHFHGEAAAEWLAVDHGEDGYVVLGDFGAFMVFSGAGESMLVIYEEDST